MVLKLVSACIYQMKVTLKMMSCKKKNKYFLNFYSPQPAFTLFIKKKSWCIYII